MPLLSPPPTYTQLVDNLQRITGKWLDWIIAPASGGTYGLQGAIQAMVYRPIDPVVLTNQNAAIPATPFALGTLPGGSYRVSWFLKVDTPDGAGSSATVTIGFTRNGAALTAPAAPVTGDTSTTFQSIASGVIQMDAGSPLTYAVAYNSTTPNKMIFEVTFVVEQLSN